ncbi:MAG: M48 family metallopeptidase [Gammaproteobacteria bacterium]|nr:M48 family metallopeptidase [Gammaproteobacteria bacterium]
MNWFTYIFLSALGSGLLLQLWLLLRHRNHIIAHRSEVPEAFTNHISLSQHHTAADYSVAKIKLGIKEIIFGSALLLAWTLGGGLQLIQETWNAMALDYNPLILGTGFILSVFLISGILDLPFSIYRTFVLENKYGFNRTTPARFLGDLLLTLALTLLLGVPIIWVILWLMQTAGDLWWLAAWAFWTGFTLLMSWAYPTLIAPLFNKFNPLEDEELRMRIQQLLDRCGFTSNGIFVMDGSRRSSHGNAYFTGLGKNKRIVFFDTLLEHLEAEEMEAVLAHELGHFKRKHILKGLVIMVISSLLGLALLGWLITQSWFFNGLGVTTESNAIALLLFLMAAPVFSQFLQPLMAKLQRKHEFEADDYAADQTGAEHMISALVKLYKENASTLTPDQLYSAFHDSHPPAPVRIAYLSSKLKMETPV